MSKHSPRRTEQAFVLDAYKRLRRSGVPSRWEAPMLGRSVDLVYLDGEDLITVEFKLSDWRRGLRQARDHRIGGDFVYLCMPNRRLSQELRIAAIAAGVGLLRFREEAEWPFVIELPAPRSTMTWTVMRQKLCALLRTRG